jgi:RimJ/RimL family protein N-acetyltransferase
LFRKAFSWPKDENKELPIVDVSGDKVKLREKCIEDIADEYQWRIDPELSRLDATRPISMSYDDFAKYTQEEMRFPSYRSKRLAVDTLEGNHIGSVMYYDYDKSKKQAEIGIMIGDKSYWGQGYGTDTLTVLVSYLYSELKLDRIYLHTLSWNYRAQASFVKSGFKTVKPVKRGGQDFFLMDSLRQD